MIEVHRLAEAMLAVLGDAARAGAQHLVRGRRAIGGDDVDVVARAALLVDRPDEIEQLRVHLGVFVPPPVAEEVIEPPELAAVDSGRSA